jgi:hypothetical protein
MPRVISDRQEDARIARAWAAFVRDDAAASAPPALQARVMRAARTAVDQRRRAEAERERHRWIAGTSAIAASLLAAAAWWLSVITPPPVTGDATATTTPTAAAPHAPAASAAAAAPARPAAAPMINVEAGRILATPPHALLASRPLFDAAETGVVGVRGVPRARAYHAPVVEPAPYARTEATPGRREAAAPEPVAAPIVVAPDAWATRDAVPRFDPDTAEPVAAPAPLADRKPPAAPREIPPPPKR